MNNVVLVGDISGGRWPPSDDTPIVVDDDGNTISRFGDTAWDISIWAGRPTRLNFGDGEVSRNKATRIDPENARLLRLSIAHAIWIKSGSRRAPNSLRKLFDTLRKVFALCSKHGFLATDLAKYPIVIGDLPGYAGPAISRELVAMLHDLYLDRDELGFEILDPVQLRRLAAIVPKHAKKQTAYIPPRIWSYQLARIQAFFDDFRTHQEGIGRLFDACTDAYVANYGSVANACVRYRNTYVGPFSKSALEVPEMKYLGRFEDVAASFGVDKLLRRWCGDIERPDKKLNVSALAKYFTQVGYVGVAYIINFGLMRIAEAQGLRVNCSVIESDRNFGKVYLVRGETSKTIKDDRALWVVSPAVQEVVESMAIVARYRIGIAKMRSDIRLTQSDAESPRLLQRSCEPWSNAAHAESRVAMSTRTYDSWRYHAPKLFSDSELMITEDDLSMARLVSTDLDSEKYKVGKPWPLSWHQLRRTGAVNMFASGLVSDSSVQFQLKHSRPAMTYYYGRGYSERLLDRSLRAECIRAAYEGLGAQANAMLSERFVSPLGSEHKRNILKAISPLSTSQLREEAKAGRIAWRETLLGGCTNPQPCEYGGVDNIVRCGGGDGKAPCSQALFDRKKIGAILELKRVIQESLAAASSGSPYADSLKMQLLSVENAIDITWPKKDRFNA